MIVKTIAENTKEKGELISINDYKEVPPAIMSFIQILLGLKLQINELIMQGLTSDDISINRKALKANWFFNGINNHVNVDNFTKNIMPFVSINTRSSIIRKLSHSLNGFEGKAEAFFNTFVELYGLEESLPILTACSQPFIQNKIFEYKIELPSKDINVLFKKYPNLVIQYLHLGTKNNLCNNKDRQIIQVQIHDYDSFILKLIKHYPKDFIELYKRTPEKTLKLGNKLSNLFIRNSKYELLDNPNVFLKLMSLKVVNRGLDKISFANMITNLFPKDESDFNLTNMLRCCKFYKKDNVVDLLRNKYKEIYNNDLLDNKLCLESVQFFKMLSYQDKEAMIRSFLKKNENNSHFVNTYKYYLPPMETLPRLKKQIEMTASAEERAELIGQMIISCSLYKSKHDLLDVIDFYNKNHKNERNLVLVKFFQYLKQEFDLKSLNPHHWGILNEIIFHAYVKKELFNSYVDLVEFILEACLFNVITHDKDNNILLDKILNIMVELKMEQFSTFNILIDTKLEKEYMEKFFEKVPLKYPEDHDIWKIEHDRLTLALNFAKSINNYNNRNHCTKPKRKFSKKNVAGNESIGEKKIKIENYPWIIKLAEEFFPAKQKQSSIKRNILMKIIKRNAPDLYEEKMNALVRIRSVESGEALTLLKKNPKRILDNWLDYLVEARKKLSLGNKAAKRFVTEVKWYQDIPIKFIDKCLAELKEEGSFQVLAILLESSVFEKIIVPYVPVNNHIDLNESNVKENYELTKSIIKALKYANPPISLNVVASFCKADYALLAEDTISKTVHYVPAHTVVNFAMKFVDGTTFMKKQSLRLIQKVATKSELRDFLEEQLKKESNQSVRQLMAKMILNLFIRSPNPYNWKLMKSCIDQINIDDQVMEIFSDLGEIDSNFLPAYIDAYINRIESDFNDDNLNSRVKCILLLIENLDSRIINLISEELSERIVKKYFFDADSMEISRATQNFAIRLYLLQSGEKFEYRLNIIIQILKGIMENFNMPHPKKPRFYAANYTIQQFFNDMLVEISCSNNDKKLEIIESMLKVLNSTLSTWQEPWTHLSLNFYREYLLSNSPTNFGSRCAKRIFDLMSDFSRSEFIINEIAKCLEDIIDKKIYRHMKNPDLKLSVIEGIIKEDNYYANLVGIKLLDYNEVNMYDSRYDSLIKIVSKNQNTVIQCSLYQHLNKIASNYNEM
jgi:hypothetical protein